MHNLWLVAKNEYRRTVLRKAFLIATLSIPAAILVLVGLVLVIERSGQDNGPVGYVDDAGVMDESLQATLPDPEERVPIYAYPDKEAALAALQRGEVQAFFVLSEGYPASLATELYTLEGSLGGRAWEQFDDLVRASLVAGYPEEVQQRLLDGSEVTVYDVGSGRQFSESGIANIILPIVAAAFFFIATMIASGYMLEAVAREKENRTLEVLVTSVTPVQLIAGKTVGLLGAVLTQLAVYAAALVVGIAVASPFVPELQQVVVPWGFLGMVVLLFFPAYLLFAAIMVTIGASVTEMEQGQQVAGMLNLLFMAPLFVLPLLLENSTHPLIVGMSLFPITSFLTLSLRWGLGSVPVWQVALGWGLLAASAVAMVWVAARIFRAGMLVYGQPLSAKAAWAALRG
ncbi:MAG TPA: ABC transporter permease [Anaerolineae bacterium]|nr:ABC transporter permease [Anaerolineae bacterium]